MDKTKIKENVEFRIKKEDGSILEIVVTKENILTDIYHIQIPKISIVSYYFRKGETEDEKDRYGLSIYSENSDMWIPFNYEINARQAYNILIGLIEGTLKMPEKEVEEKEN